jgi:hypothetical protein
MNKVFGRGRAKVLARTLAALAAIYLLLSAGLYLVMLRSPATIASVFKHVPGPAWVALPMRPMWLQARGGDLRVGDEAPAFELASHDGQSRVSLASLRGRPAVLVFGSYT